MDYFDGINRNLMSRGTTFYIVTACIALIVGAVLPIYFYSSFSGGELIFINFEIFDQENVKFLLKLFFIYPLIAGMAGLFLIRIPDQVIRAIALTVLAFLPLILMIVNSSVSNQMGRLSMGGADDMIGFSAIGWLLIFIGAFTLQVRPEYKTALFILSLGCLFYMIAQFMEGASDSIMLLYGFEQLFSSSEAVIVHFSGLCHIASQVLAGLIIYRTVQIWQSPQFTQMHSYTIQQLWVIALLVSFLPLVYLIIDGIIDSPKQIPTIIMTLIKMFAWVGGIFVLAIFSCIELLLCVDLDQKLNLNTIINRPTGEMGHSPNSSSGFSSSAQSEQPQMDIAEQLNKLLELKEKGLISEEEYIIKKREILTRF